MTDSLLRIAVTGGIGMLGSAVIDWLVERGHTPVCVDLAGPKPVDICDGSALASAFEGCDGVIHCASIVDLHLGQPDAMRRVNVEGTRSVISACRAAGVPRLVYMSSAEVITGATPLRGVNEGDASYPDEHLTFYGETKQAAEELVLGAADNSLGTTALRTYGLFGVGDQTMVPMYLERVPGSTSRYIGNLAARSDVVFAGNLAHALVTACEQLTAGVEWSGTPFHVTDSEPVNVQVFLAELARGALGWTIQDKPRLPRGIVERLASMYEWRWRATRMDRFARPPITHHSLRLVLDDYWLDGLKIRETLSWEPPVSRSAAIALTIEWLQSSQR